MYCLINSRMLHGRSQLAWKKWCVGEGLVHLRIITWSRHRLRSKIWLTFWKNLYFCDQTRASWQIFLLKCFFTEQFTIWKHFPDPLLFFHTSEDISRSLMITCKIQCLKIPFSRFQNFWADFSQKTYFLSKIIEKVNCWLH